MKTHLTKLLGLFAFIAIALGSATSNEVINAQNRLAAQGKWTNIAPGTDRILWYDPYSLNQISPDVFHFMLMATDASGQSGRVGPNQVALYCASNQYEDFVLQGDALSTKTLGLKAITEGTLQAVMKNRLCGQRFKSDNNVYFYAATGGTNVAFFIRDNEVNVDLKTGIRVLNIVAFIANEQKLQSSTLSADCSSKKIRFDANDWVSLSGTGNDPNSVLWDRACNDARTYMKKISGGASSGGSVSSTGSLDAAKNKCTELGLKAGTESFGKCVLQMSR